MSGATNDNTLIRRFSLSDRFEHLIQLVTFSGLAITGLVQRYPGAWLSRRIIDLLGGVESIRIIHRVLATILMIGLVYHIVVIGYRKFVLRAPRVMIPGLQDLKNGWQLLKFNLGLAEERPRQGRFTIEEKVEYYALVWGTLVMVLTGFMLWNPIVTASWFPGEWIPVAKAAHSGEALLAALAILVWHLYHVHIKHFNKSMFTGNMTRHEMLEEHPIELERIEAGEPEGETDPEVLAKRKLIYFPIANALAVLLLGGVWLFITAENTALDLETITPPEQVAIFAPVEVSTTLPPATTTTTTTVPDGPAAAGSWEAVAPLFSAQCTGCHSAAMASAGLDLSSYEGVLAGGDGGPAVVPGDSAAGTLVPKMQGSHPAVFDAGGLDTLVAWIDAGAPAPSGDTGDQTTTTVVASGVDSCTTCHTDEDALRAMAMDPVETEHLSTGEG